MAPTTTVRVHPETRDALARLSEQRGLNTADLLADMVKRQEEDELLEQMNASYARQLGDEPSAAEERLERERWDATLADGLGDL